MPIVLEDPVHFPGLAGIKRMRRRRRRRGDVSRRLRPASRLVPVLAARKLRHARPRALRRRADARLHARREGPQDVEVARQPDLPAGRHQGSRAPTSCACGWRASTIPTTSASARKSSRRVSDNYRKLRNTHPLDARHARALRRRPTRVGFADMAPLERLMLHRLAELDGEGARGLRQFRLRARRRGAVGVHERRSLGVLFRHPQGRALLRGAVERQAARRAGGDRAHLPRRDDLAGADPRLHRARRPGPRAIAERALRASRAIPRHSRRMARRRAGGEVGDDPPRPLGRHRRDRDRARRQARSAPRWRRARASIVSDAGAARGARRRRFRRGLHHLATSRSRRRASAPDGAFRLPDAPGVAVVGRARARGSNARAPGAISIPRPPIPTFPTSRPRDAAALRELNAARRA